MVYKHFLFFVLIFSNITWSQEDIEFTIEKDTLQVNEQVVDTKKKRKEKSKDIKVLDSIPPSVIINPLAPSKAAFYSAILPGLGQVYNKKYWKLPLVYGAIGTGVAVYMWNDERYRFYRSAYKLRIEGQKDQFAGVFSDDVLIRAQRNFGRQRDLALMATVGLYVLNIIDANVDAHLKQFNVDDNLSLSPEFSLDPTTFRPVVGLTFQWTLD